MGKRNGYRSGCVSFGLCSWGKVSGDEIARVRKRERDVMIGELFSSEFSSPFYFYKGASICFLDLSRSIWIVSHFLLIDRFNSRKERKV